MAKSIMLQGTMSNVGKSFLTAALCRIFRQDGYSVAPFKSQNMALNSFITPDGAEIGRAQALQAEAAGISPSALMNPILLKPTTDVGSQVIVNGKVRGNMRAADYFRRKKELIPDIMTAYKTLSSQHDIIVIEGAGSPVELNLKADENKTSALHRIRGIYPAYHMNHSKWISVTLDDTLEDRDVMDLMDESFRLTAGAAKPMNEKLMREVYAVADSIPPGKVMSYGQIAALLGRPKNSRLIGKIMSLADRYGDHPCHRVVNSAGRTVPGWPEQRELLEAEGVTFRNNGNVDMAKHRVE